MSYPEHVPHAILLVDDSTIVVDSVRRWLKRAGYEVVIANTCAEARRLAQGSQFIAHIIDMQLSDGRGIDLAVWLRDNTRGAATIFYTGEDATSEPEEEVVRIGQVVSKSSSADTLLKVLRDAIVATCG